MREKYTSFAQLVLLSLYIFCYIQYIWKHEFFCLGRLGSQAVREKSGFEEFWATLDGSFPTFVGQNKHLNFFAKLL